MSDNLSQFEQAIMQRARDRVTQKRPTFWQRLFRRPVPATFTENERLALLAHRMSQFQETMKEERSKRGHIVYPEGAAISPSEWPACPPNCEHVIDHS
jgi:uncharacterized protein VirK/YbjX